MKKIFFFSALLTCLDSLGQYPVNQSLGSDSTLVTSRGATKSRFINKVFTDTTQANLERIKFYDGAQIYTKSGGGQLWIRDSALNKWVSLLTTRDRFGFSGEDVTSIANRTFANGAFNLNLTSTTGGYTRITSTDNSNNGAGQLINSFYVTQNKGGVSDNSGGITTSRGIYSEATFTGAISGTFNDVLLHHAINGRILNAGTISADAQTELVGGHFTSEGNMSGTGSIHIGVDGNANDAANENIGVVGLATGGTTNIGGRFSASGTNASAIITNPGGGNVGLGTLTPTHQLTVNGQVRINSINNASLFDSVLFINDGVVESGLASSIVGAVPTLQQVLTAGSVLTGGATNYVDINAGTLGFTFGSTPGSEAGLYISEDNNRVSILGSGGNLHFDASTTTNFTQISNGSSSNPLGSAMYPDSIIAGKIVSGNSVRMKFTTDSIMLRRITAGLIDTTNNKPLGINVASGGIVQMNSWAQVSGGSSLTSTQVGYGDGSNALTGEAAFNYTAASDLLAVGSITTSATTNQIILNNSTRNAELDLDASYVLNFGHNHAASDNVTQYNFKYHSAAGHETRGLRMSDVGNGFTTVLSQLASGKLYWTDAAGAAGILSVGSWENPNDGTTITNGTGFTKVNTQKFGVNVTPTTALHTTAFATAYAAKTTTYPITADDHTIEATSGTFTTTLPTAVGITGRQYVITNSGSGVVTLATTSSQTFVNVTATPTTLTLNQFNTVIVVSNGANWLRVSSL